MAYRSLTPSLTRRSFLAASATLPFLRPARAAGSVPVGLELYSVRNTLQKDLKPTVTAVAKMGYQVVEFYSPYFKWTPDYAKEIRALMDDLGIRCNSTHNDAKAFTGDDISKAIELNHIIGAKYVVMASPGGRVADLAGWQKVAETISVASEKLKAASLRAGYHNHGPEFTPIEGKRPIEVIAANTPKDVMLQLDVGTCVASGSDPVAWIKANPGRIRALHLKDWASGGEDKGYRVLFGEGASPWKEIFAAAESVGGVEYYLIEQEGSRYPELETVDKCLANFKQMRA
jgi:sugar phosphate isomerase/epimerase